MILVFIFVYTYVFDSACTTPDLALSILIKKDIMYKHCCSSARLKSASVRQYIISTVSLFHVDLRRFGRHLSDYIIFFAHDLDITNHPLQSAAHSFYRM